MITVVAAPARSCHLHFNLSNHGNLATGTAWSFTVGLDAKHERMRNTLPSRTDPEGNEKMFLSCDFLAFPPGLLFGMPRTYLFIYFATSEEKFPARQKPQNLYELHNLKKSAWHHLFKPALVPKPTRWHMLHLHETAAVCVCLCCESCVLVCRGCLWLNGWRGCEELWQCFLYTWQWIQLMCLHCQTHSHQIRFLMIEMSCVLWDV